jgi:hypothetical protein
MSNAKMIQMYWDTIASSRSARMTMSNAEVTLAEQMKPLVIEGWLPGDEVTATHYDGHFYETGLYADYTHRDSHSEVIDLQVYEDSAIPKAFFVGEWNFQNNSLRGRQEAAKVEA